LRRTAGRADFDINACVNEIILLGCVALRAGRRIATVLENARSFE